MDRNRQEIVKHVLNLRRNVYGMQALSKANKRKAFKLLKAGNIEHAEAFNDDAAKQAAIISFLEDEIKYINYMVRQDYGAA
jgi:hypothetical protein